MHILFVYDEELKWGHTGLFTLFTCELTKVATVAVQV